MLRIVLLFAAGVLFLSALGGIDLWAPDEPRYAQVAEEIRSMKHGWQGFVLLHLNDEVYTQKPPLYYWSAALFGTPGDRVTEVAARLPSALAGIGVLWLTLRLGAALFGGATAALAGALLLTTPYFTHLARRAQLDVLLSFFEILALSLFWGIDSGKARGRKTLALLHAAMGLAFLTKGPVGILVPVFVMAIYLGWERRLRDLRSFFPPWSFLLSIGPGVAWFAGALLLSPAGFFEDAFIDNVLLRFFGEASHPRPFYYYLYALPAIFLPWTLAWFFVWRAGRVGLVDAATDEPTRRAWRFLLSWVGGTVLFFSISSGKRELYVLAAFTPLVILCSAALLRSFGAHRETPPWLTGAARVLATLGGLVGVSLLVTDEIAGVPLPNVYGFTLLGLVAATGALWLRVRRSGRPAIWALGTLIAGVYAGQLIVFTAVLPLINPQKSLRAAAVVATDLTREGEPIGLLRNAPMIGGLVYYTGRPVVYLESRKAARAFMARGGGVIVLKASKLPLLRDLPSIEVKSRSRKGSRSIFVVGPAGRTGNSD